MINSSVLRRILSLLAVLALVAGACGDDDTDDVDAGDDDAEVDDAADDDMADDAADDDMADDAEVDDAADDDMADDDMADDDMADDDAGEGAERGTIEASFVGTPVTATGEALVDDEVKVYFNNGSNGTLVAIYHGPGLADPAGLCPGNSINTGTFEHVSNAPASAGACDGFPTDVGSVRVCTSNVWLYETKIPNDSAGTLYASLEGRDDAGNIIGHYGTAENQPGTPEIDVSFDTYDIDPMFTGDGSAEITCAAALT